MSNAFSVLVGSHTADRNPGNNSATDTDTLTPQADLAITKTDGVTTAVPGGSVTYTVTASNAGPDPVVGGTVADTFPAVLTCTWTCVGAGGGTCTAAGAGNINDLVNLPAGGSVTYTLTGTVATGTTGSLSNTATVSAPAGVTDPTPGNNSATDTDTVVTAGLDYFTVTPCRIADTRTGLGGPVVQGQETRVFPVAGLCGVPLSATSISLNVTVNQATAAGDVRLFEAGQPVPNTSTINYVPGKTRANNAIVKLNGAGAIAAYARQAAGSTVHLIIDVNGYFE
jgi:uncharacterized repeat protein (TIGR01451 family)